MTNDSIEAVVSEMPGDSTPRQLTVAGNVMSVTEVRKAIHGAGAWFWWIAALSVVNSIAVILDLKYGMALGLGFTQVIDAIFSFGADGEAMSPGATARVIQLSLVGAVAGGFYALGRAARRCSTRAFAWGMGLYALDALIFVLVGDWIGVGFHVFVLFMLWGGFSILRSARSQMPDAFAPGAA